MDTSTAANGVFVAQGNRFATASIAQIIFVGSSTAESGVFTCEAASVSGGIGGLLKFDDIGSTAADAVITLQGATVSGAGSGFAQFFGSSTAGNSKITATAAATGASPASVEFAGDSTGGAAQISLASNTQLIVSAHRLPGVAVGSVDGSGNIILGTSTTAGRKLTVGTNNLEMAISGTISDGGNAGSIIKAGTGRLTLSGASTYTGGTTLSAGTLSVTNRTGSATGTGAVQVAAGTLGGSGIIAGPVTIATGSVASFLAPALGSSRQATLTIQDALTFNPASTYAHSFKAKGNQTKADSVVANGVTIASGATVTFRGMIQGTLPAGLVISLISNTSASPISGTFSNLADGAIATISGNNFQADYEGGDGNDLTLTVVP
ncbi:MAG TPA: autotransporter-associated beta strand repeat-containing protein [Chthoniobacterales bacterium]